MSEGAKYVNTVIVNKSWVYEALYIGYIHPDR